MNAAAGDDPTVKRNGNCWPGADGPAAEDEFAPAFGVVKAAKKLKKILYKMEKNLSKMAH